jgi:hypothetical protein
MSRDPLQYSTHRRAVQAHVNEFQKSRSNVPVQGPGKSKLWTQSPKMTEDRKKRFGNVSTAPKDVLRLRMFRLPCGQEAHLSRENAK